MFNPDHIGQLMSDQLSEFTTLGSSHKQALIEPELMDDEGVDDRLCLNRWQDRQYRRSA